MLRLLRLGRDSLIADGAWVAFGQISSAIGTLASVRILTGVLSPSAYGSVSLFMGIILLAQGVVSTPVLQAMLRFRPDCAKIVDVASLYKAIRKMLGVRTAGGAFLLLAAGVGAQRFFDFAPSMIVLTVGLFCSESWRAYHVNFFNAEKRQREFAIWTAIDAWLKPIAAIIMVLVGGGSPESVYVGYVCASITSSIALYLRHHTMTPIRDAATIQQEDARLFSTIRHYSLPLLPLAIIGWFNGMIDRYMIGATLGLDQAGMYAAVYGLVSRPFLMVGLVFEQTFRQAYYQATSHGDRAHAVRLFRIWLSLVTIACLAGVTLILVLQNYLANLLLGPAFRGASFLMPWISGAYCLVTISQVFERILYARHATTSVLVIQSCGALTITLLMYLLLASHGLVGATVSLLSAASVQLGAFVIVSARMQRQSQLPM